MSLNISLIKESFEKAKPIADQVANKFYEFCGGLPTIKTTFNGVNMEKQKSTHKLVGLHSGQYRQWRQR